jgi:hypothetical protein
MNSIKLIYKNGCQQLTPIIGKQTKYVINTVVQKLSNNNETRRKGNTTS